MTKCHYKVNCDTIYNAFIYVNFISMILFRFCLKIVYFLAEGIKCMNDISNTSIEMF